MKDSERAMLIEHIMDTNMPSNLAIALDTADVIVDIKTRTIVTGAKALIARVTECDYEGSLLCIDDSLAKEPMRRWARIEFRRERWPIGHAVGIVSDAGSASQVFIGVSGSSPLDERLFQLLTEYHASGAGTEHWPWWFWPVRPYTRLTSSEAVLKLHSGTAVDDLAPQLASIVAIVDRYCSEETLPGN